MLPEADELLEQAFADHLKRQPRPRPTNYQAYWFGLGVKAMRREMDPLLERLRKAELELKGRGSAGDGGLVGAGNGHGA